MFYDLFWRIARVFLTVLRKFDHNIIANEMWKIKIKKITNCPCLSHPDVTTRVTCTCFMLLDKTHQNEAIVTNSEDYKAGEGIKFDWKKNMPRITLKVYVPFKCSSISLGVTLIDTAINRKVVGNVSQSDVAPGIHKFEFFPGELIKQFCFP